MEDSDIADSVVGQPLEEVKGVAGRDRLPAEVYAFLEEVTQKGLFQLIAYGLDPDKRPHDVCFVTSSIPNMALAVRLLQDWLQKTRQEEYHFGRFVPLTSLERFAGDNRSLMNHETRTVNSFQANLHRNLLGRVASSCGASHWSLKGFGLVDICGFSRMRPEEQMACRTSLALCMQQASQRVYHFFESGHLRGRCSFCRTSTGDGYYFWHRDPGGSGDMATFALLLSLMTQNRALRIRHRTNLRLRGAFAIGEAYTFPFRDFGPFRLSNEGDLTHDAIGPVLNGLARLAEAASAEQILVGIFERPGREDREEIMTPKQMILQAQRELFPSELSPGETVTASDIELRFDPDDALRVVDKHGETYYCMNIVGALPNRCPDEGVQLQKIGLEHDTKDLLRETAFRDPQSDSWAG